LVVVKQEVRRVEREGRGSVIFGRKLGTERGESGSERKL
jgi:hypothetical protein